VTSDERNEELFSKSKKLIANLSEIEVRN